MSKRIMVGNVPVGGGAPVSIQSMCNTRTDDVAATVAQIHALEAAGCEIVRIAIPDQAAAEAVDRIKSRIVTAPSPSRFGPLASSLTRFATPCI